MIIIDGHNLIGSLKCLSFNDLGVKVKLIAMLNTFNEQRNNKIIVVFDGQDISGFPRFISGNIEIIYPDTGRLADNKIIELIEKNANNRDIIIVSSDNEIIKKAKKFHLNFIKSNEFAENIISLQKNNLSENQFNESKNIDVQDWINYFKHKK